MRALRRLAVACLALTATAALAAAPTLAESLLAKLAKAPPVSTPFIQVSYRGMLDRPLVVSGTLRWLGGDRMQRDIDKPFKETAQLGDGELSVQRGSGEVHRMPLARAPQAGAMLAGFRALLGGDLAALENDFALSAQGSQAHWVITLVPRTDQLKRQLASIVIDGRTEAPRCLTMTDANGDTSITLVGAMAKQGLQSVAPLESALAARCRNQ
ncbi:MAG: outer membrane lipoprotein carrier protein LolA [Rhodanobacteraceae bacterium]|nr:MAG: outer membrane lipoprotein carrier protein LolA [Rhodanobacteraceae bacterium]